MQRSRCVSRERFAARVGRPATCRNWNERIWGWRLLWDRSRSLDFLRASRIFSRERRRKHTRGATWRLAESDATCLPEFTRAIRARENSTSSYLVRCTDSISGTRATVCFKQTKRAGAFRCALAPRDSRGSRDAAGGGVACLLLRRRGQADQWLVRLLREIRINVAPGAIRKRVVKDHRFWRANALERLAELEIPRE